MRTIKVILRNGAVILVMLFLIFDAKTAAAGASEGIDLCLRSVIPSLFPFLFLSIIFTSSLANLDFAPLRGICRLCKIPDGCASILIMSFLGGYPVGAQAVYRAWREGKLNTNSARRLLGFCNNCGPSFIFGILGSFFSLKCASWLLWSVQILSSLLVGALLPGECESTINMQSSKPVSFTGALTNSVRAMTSICGWVILFRTLLVFLNKYIPFSFSAALNVIFGGLLELTNGCFLLDQIPNEGVRFIVASVILTGGGLCVFLQTCSVTDELGTGMYFPGKLLQSCISLILSVVTAVIIYPLDSIF